MSVSKFLEPCEAGACFRLVFALLFFWQCSVKLELYMLVFWSVWFDVHTGIDVLCLVLTIPLYIMSHEQVIVWGNQLHEILLSCRENSKLL